VRPGSKQQVRTDIAIRISLRESAELQPQGAMHLMVYAAYGRTGIYMMQEYCRLLEVSPASEELHDLATTVGALPVDHPIACVLRQAKDFTHPDALADALLHPQDRAYTVPELYACLERSGMSFGRWFEQAAYLPHCGIVARTPHFERLAALPAQLQHGAVELFRGTMTRHSIIAYRDDRIGDSQPIAFDSDGWRDCVPLRLPWTLAIRERVPPVTSSFSSTGHTPTPISPSPSMRWRSDCLAQSTGSARSARS
jgi:hypothetical protein